eukprot:Nitzschia sp. Nitz4//scaffold11_size288233//284721//287471//NITZ4_000830-RA/size288233-snap-gene-0.68-mRNA-1//-1//CDS//3329534242//5353//frame0
MRRPPLFGHSPFPSTVVEKATRNRFQLSPPIDLLQSRKTLTQTFQIGPSGFPFFISHQILFTFPTRLPYIQQRILVSMGSCQSTAAENPVSAYRSVNLKRLHVDEDNDSVNGLTSSTRSLDHSSGFSTPCKHSSLHPSSVGSPTTPISRNIPHPILERGYSSGASSVSSAIDSSSAIDDNSMRLSASRKHMLQLRHSLSIDGDICKGVVRIETDLGRPIEEVYEGVHDGTLLGSGGSGTVREVKHRKTGVKYACKCLNLCLIEKESGRQALQREVGIMCQLDHPNIVRLEEVYENENEIYLIQELCTGGDLFDRLEEQTDYHYSEAHCARLVKQMLCAVRYLHSKNVIHRDIKLENFLFSSSSNDSELKLIDFGLSKHFTQELEQESVGTPYTVAPEVITSKYNEKVDIWAIGVITYLLLSGETPFGGADGEELEEVRRNILRAKCSFEPEEIWNVVSDSAKKFVVRLLNPDSEKRPTAKEAQKDDWLQVYAKKDLHINTHLSPGLCQSLVEFKEFSKMRKVLCEILSFTLLPEQIVGLRKEFEKVDPDGEGEISWDTLKQVLKSSAESGALGPLTENEIESIFYSFRIRNTSTSIRWHEFIAAGLSQCNVDERNLKLAFDRLDVDRKGYITFEDVKGMLGSEGDDEDLCQMWDEGISECKCPLGHVSYDDFRRYVKGQKVDKDPAMQQRRKSKDFTLDGIPLHSVLEGDDVDPPVPPKPPRKQSEGDLATLTGKPTRTVRVYRRKRSKSLGDLPGEMKEDTVEVSVIVDGPTHQDVVEKHRDFRLSVQAALRRFDAQQSARKVAKSHSGGLDFQGEAWVSANLTKKHRVKPTRSDSKQKLSDRLSKACNRSGRRRMKTTSDVSGMF